MRSRCTRGPFSDESSIKWSAATAQGVWWVCWIREKTHWSRMYGHLIRYNGERVLCSCNLLCFDITSHGVFVSKCRGALSVYHLCISLCSCHWLLGKQKEREREGVVGKFLNENSNFMPPIRTRIVERALKQWSHQKCLRCYLKSPLKWYFWCPTPCVPHVHVFLWFQWFWTNSRTNRWSYVPNHY